MEEQRNAFPRRAVLFGVPIIYVVLGLLHPTSNPELSDPTTLFIVQHVAQLFLIGGVAYLFWLLVGGIDSRAARVARALILAFVIAYTALDSVLGIAWGIVVREADELPTADQAAAGRLVEALLVPKPLGYIAYLGAGLLFLAVALSVVRALWTRGPRGALALMAIGATVFTLGHAQPMGPIGMSLFLVGVVWLEVRPRREHGAHAPRCRGLEMRPLTGTGQNTTWRRPCGGYSDT